MNSGIVLVSFQSTSSCLSGDRYPEITIAYLPEYRHERAHPLTTDTRVRPPDYGHESTSP